MWVGGVCGVGVVVWCVRGGWVGGGVCVCVCVGGGVVGVGGGVCRWVRLGGRGRGCVCVQ